MIPISIPSLSQVKKRARLFVADRGPLLPPPRTKKMRDVGGPRIFATRILKKNAHWENTSQTASNWNLLHDEWLATLLLLFVEGWEGKGVKIVTKRGWGRLVGNCLLGGTLGWFKLIFIAQKTKTEPGPVKLTRAASSVELSLLYFGGEKKDTTFSEGEGAFPISYQRNRFVSFLGEDNGFYCIRLVLYSVFCLLVLLPNKSICSLGNCFKLSGKWLWCALDNGFCRTKNGCISCEISS